MKDNNNMQEDIRGFMDDLFDKAKTDKTGKMEKLIEVLVESGRTAGDLDLSMPEIMGCITLGFYISKNPEVKQMFDMLKVGSKYSNPDEFN